MNHRKTVTAKLARAARAEKRIAQFEASGNKPDFDLTAGDLSPEASLDRLLSFFHENATTSAAWPKTAAEQHRERLIDAADRLVEIVADIKCTASRFRTDDERLAAPRDVLLGELSRALVAAWEIGQYGNATAGADQYFKSKRSSQSGKKGAATNKAKSDARFAHFAKLVDDIKAEKPRRVVSQEDMMPEVRNRWSIPGSKPSTRVMGGFFARLNKAKPKGRSATS